MLVGIACAYMQTIRPAVSAIMYHFRFVRSAANGGRVLSAYPTCCIAMRTAPPVSSAHPSSGSRRQRRGPERREEIEEGRRASRATSNKSSWCWIREKRLSQNGIRKRLETEALASKNLMVTRIWKMKPLKRTQLAWFSDPRSSMISLSPSIIGTLS